MHSPEPDPRAAGSYPSSLDTICWGTGPRLDPARQPAGTGDVGEPREGEGCWHGANLHAQNSTGVLDVEEPEVLGTLSGADGGRDATDGGRLACPTPDGPPTGDPGSIIRGYGLGDASLRRPRPRLRDGK